ncbi:GtrA family protein [Sphingobacterium gobiense]|uniref:GtrA family protein n=1 Tax=Sphingobacterium gobiense TaxID=1382456 RepID=A0A2S9JID9_9SPHI|nr:GtrA family protein [Sphingobacterium gobiense]PRD52780.1 GtrA family protein [Sphingobacterium gobiense]
MKKKHKVVIRDFLLSFGKAQVSAFLGGLFDFSVYTICIQVLGFTAYISNIISGSLGAVVNFTINRCWTFGSTGAPVGKQLGKFVMVVIGSISLKSMGIFFLVDHLLLNPYYSKIIVEILVSLGFNFLMQKYWVFRK